MSKKDVELKYCCGCGLCGSFVPGGENERGYYRPDENIFPGNFDTSVCYCNQFANSGEEGMWGPLKGVYYGFSLDRKIRKLSSSGGMLTSIACYLLQTGKVDYIVQIAPDQNDCMSTEVVFNNDIEEVKKCCGSRYTASAALSGLLERIDITKKYAVIGKPCDIRVLRAYLNKHTELNSTILYLLSFFCGGTPSRQANDKLLSKMNLNRSELESFVYRGNGWPGKTTGIEKDGVISQVEYEESWGEILGRDLQEICRFCWEGVGEAADICCGDGWYLKNNQPSFEEKDGRNIIFARTEKGNELLLEMNADALISLETVSDLNIMKFMQPGQYMRKGAMFSRVLAMKIMRRSVPDYPMMKIWPYAKALTFEHNIRMFGGTVKRILKGTIK